MKNKFEMRVTEPPLLAKNAPDQSVLSMCQNLGRQISESLIHLA
jgi:hypothetical protein